LNVRARFQASTFRALALVGLAAFGAAPAWAQGQRPGSAAVEPAEVRAWLTRIHNAASQRNFIGTLVVSVAGGPVSSTRVAHFVEGGTQLERSESLDGQARHVFRVNGTVQTVWPENRVAMVEQRDSVNNFPALLQGGDDRITEFYELRSEGLDRVAGHEASVLLLSPRDGHRYGYRLWAEKATGLLLRADVLNEQGKMLETSAFSDVAIGVKGQPDSVLLPMKKLDGYRVLRPTLQPAKLEAEGWVFKALVPGFKQVSCVKRAMALNSNAEPAAAPAVQAIFSDGLTYVSVFIEPDAPERQLRDGLTVSGATRTFRKRHGEYWVTVVGDVPQSALNAFYGALERRK